MKPFITRIDIKTLLFLNCNFKRTEYNKSGTVHTILLVVPDGQKLAVLIVIIISREQK